MQLQRGENSADAPFPPLYSSHGNVSGPHSVEVCYDGSPVPKSPFRVAVTEGCDPARVRVHGPGLKTGITNKPNKFTVETRYMAKTDLCRAENEISFFFLNVPHLVVAEEQELVVLVWPWKVHQRQRCPALIIRMAAAVWSIFHMRQEPTTST